MAKRSLRTSHDGESNKKAAKSRDESLTSQQAIEVIISGEITLKEAKRCIQVLRHESRNNGLSPEEIVLLVNSIEDDFLSESIKKKLISCLLPSEHVPNLAVITAVQCMTCPTFPLSVQVEFAQWLCAVFEMLESTESLSCLYSVLFSLIDCEAMQPYICELLFKLSRREDATPFRIRVLIDLQSEAACPPHVLLLLQLYATYRPDVVLVHCRYKRSFKPLGTLYTHITKKIADSEQPRKPGNINIESLILKREITKYSDLNEIIERLHGNFAVTKFLQSPLCRTLLFSDLPETFMIRLYLFLKMALYSESAYIHSHVKFTRNELLPLLSNISSELNEGFPVVQSFLVQYLEIWDGQKNCEAVFNLLSLWNICKLDYIMPMLDHLYSHFCCSPVQFMCPFLESFTELYKNWCLFEVPRLISKKKDTEFLPTTKKLMTVFVRSEEDVEEPKAEIVALAEYIDKLCRVALLIHRSHPTQLLYQVLHFYRTSLVVHRNEKTYPLLIPPVSVMCAFFFSTNPAILSLASNLLVSYKNAISALKKSTMPLAPQYITDVNYYIIDLCNILALKLSSKEVKDSVFFNKRLLTILNSTTPRIDECFLLYRHPAMLGSMLTYIKEMTEEPFLENFLSDRTLRKPFFHHIRTQGFHGVIYFLLTFIIQFSRRSN